MRLAVEALEPREVPSAAALLLEGFDQIGRDLPADWAQWSNQPAGAFAVAPNQGLASRAGLVSGGASGTEARAWAGAALPADVRASVAIYLDSLVPATLFVRGQKLDTAAPSFYGVSVTRGAEVNLIRVIDGQATVLGTVRSSEWLSGQWVRVSLTAEGDTLRARVFRTDTGQYLNAKGAWQGAPADALVVTDAALPGPGHAGVARPARVAGSAAFDGFEVTAPSAAEPPPTTVHEQNFDRAGAGLPAGWKQWANPASLGFHTDRELSLGGSGALRSEGSSLGVARAWLG
ncbi:MAG TPA: hypothetical protein VIL46_00320, partial [Gemmataceae bacterium]